MSRTNDHPHTESIQTIEEFHFTIGGYFSGERVVEYDGEQIRFSLHSHPMNFPSPHTQSRSVTAKSMERFIQNLNAIGVLSWKKEYIMLVMDGIEWKLSIKYNGSRSKEVYGSNEFPAYTVQGKKAFSAFEQAVEELLKQPGFFDEKDDDAAFFPSHD